MSEVPRLTSSERSPECQAAHDAADTLRQGIASSEAERDTNWRIGVGAAIKDGQWGVAMRVTEAENIPVAQYFAQTFIPGVPVDIQHVGRIRAQ